MNAAQLVVGTAGHIDHGKSRLVLALTGTDPDRLPEEKARGMTIDLGFAHSRIEECDVWFVDVPGHERFIRNMVAGATGIDAALLVVAADDSVMPQTREHAEVLSLLGVQRVIITLTKMDLVDPEWADQVEQEVRELLTQLGITPAAAVRTSAVDGSGLAELRAALARLARDHRAHRPEPRWFRLPIDRAFSIAGRGTIVTGSVAHGAIRAGEELELWPAGRRVRVRDMQTHNEARDAASGRMRLAVNLAGVALAEVRRGCTLATPGYLEPLRRFDAWITSLRMPGKVPRRRLRLRLHIATSELLAELYLAARPGQEGAESANGSGPAAGAGPAVVEEPAMSGGPAMSVGPAINRSLVRGAFAQLVTAEPIVASWGERFILRDESGQRTLGGGRVVQPGSRPWTAARPPDLEMLRTLAEAELPRRLEAAVQAVEWKECSAPRLAARTGLTDAEEAARLCARLAAEGRVAALEVGGATVVVHMEHVRRLADFLNRKLAAYLKANPRAGGVPPGQWPGWMPAACSARLRPVLADWLLARGHLATADGHVVPRGHAAAMPPEDEALLTALLAEFEEGGFSPPAAESLRCRTARNAQRVDELIRLATVRGRLVRISEGIWLHERRWGELVELVSGALRERGSLTVAQIRDLLRSTRRFVVPIVESLDAAGITRRSGDLRTLGPNAPKD
jgi:selenocysteine-specific elongation factor